MTEQEYKTISHEIAERIKDHKTDFEISMNGVNWIFDVAYTENWSEPYGATEYMGRYEMCADYIDTTLDEFTFYGAFNEDGEEVTVTIDINRLKEQIEKELV